ncbi:MAG TPA: adenosylcobinamide amidohydrolase [Anaeromyxobacter sp.]
MTAKSWGATVTLGDRCLVLQLSEPHAVLSWAVLNGGLRIASEVVWCEVPGHKTPVEPERLLRDRLAEVRLPQAVGLLTSADLARHVIIEREVDGAQARCVATVGLGNALRAGDPPGPAAPVGTINLVCQLSLPLSDLALLEALSIAAEARTAAVLDSGIASRRSGEPATGTGTDCIVVAAPDRSGGLCYAGKHTVAGHLVGAAVYDAVLRGARAWLRSRAGRTP